MQVGRARLRLPGRQPRLAVDQAQAGLPQRAVRHRRPRRGRRVQRPRPPPRALRRVLLAAYDPDADLFRTVGKCGTGFSDADLAELPARLAPYKRDEKPALVDSRQPADVWFEPGLVLEVLSAELTLSPNATAGWGQLKADSGLAMRFPRFTGRWRDDKGPQDATTTTELVDLYRQARHGT